jgi:methylthioribose-1-phosphate isomerase
MRPIVPVRRRGDHLAILDQRELPGREVVLECRTVEEVRAAIVGLAVRGAPVLGITAAHALALVAARSGARGPRGLLRELERAGRSLVGARPTAVNVSWAVDRVLAAARAGCAAPGASVSGVRALLEAEADLIEREDAAACEAIGRNGQALVPDGGNVLTHCNTGMLCTGGIGTAQGVILAAHRAGKRIHVWVDETRPVWQGARLTAWELGRLGVPRTLVADAAAGSLMAAGKVDLVVVGADRVAADGSVANKVGTYALAVLARHHRVPFYVAAPLSTIDPGTASGSDIRIEERDPAEVTAPRGVRVAEPGTPAANPAFDVTPPGLVTAIVTERGVVRNPTPARIRRIVGERRTA